MNLQALMKQAQNMQKKVMESKNEIEKKEYKGESELVEIIMNGNREVLSAKIKIDSLDKDDIEILQDMIVIAVNDANKKIKKDIEEKMGSQMGNFGSLF